MKPDFSEHREMIDDIKKHLHSFQVTRKMIKRDAEGLKSGKILSFIDKEVVLRAYREYWDECGEYK